MNAGIQSLWVADDSPFGLANLPYGVYSVPGRPPRVATRFGDYVIDLGAVLGDSGDNSVFNEPTLNGFMAQGYDRWTQIRRTLSDTLSGAIPRDAVHDLSTVTLHLPFEVADYVDFFASENHVARMGAMFRPSDPDPLPKAWKHLPISYHGRAASIVVSGTDIVRPAGQRLGPDGRTPEFGPSVRLDIEAELGFVVGTGNLMGQPIDVSVADRHIFGVVLFNDWSARDIQAWEYVPLGPNLAKSFGSTISAWVVPLLALTPARVETPKQDPVLPYLAMQSPWGLDVDLVVEWNGQAISRPPYASMYWSPAQMLAHLTVNGAPTRTGDLFASGTISGPEQGQNGAFIELNRGGTEQITVGRERRTFVEDGDEIVLSATAPGPNGIRLGFGEAASRIVKNDVDL